MKRLDYLIFSVSVILMLSSAGIAQSVPTQIDPSNVTGIMPYGSYGGAREDINFATGDLNVQIPLVSLPGRNGHNFSLNLVYDSKLWALHEFTDFNGDPTYYWQPETPSGMRLNLPTLVTTWQKVSQPNPGDTLWCAQNPIIILGDGSKHSFKNQFGCTLYLGTGGTQPYPSANQSPYDAGDGSFMSLDTSNASDIILKTKSGERLHFAVDPLSTPTMVTAFRLEDTNGNQISFTVNGAITTVVDSVGRAITINNANSSTTTVSSLDSNGTARTTTLTWGTAPPSPAFTLPSGATVRGASSGGVASVTLPTGRTYSFTYNNYGELTKIIYPTGGYTRYDYSLYQAIHTWGTAPSAPAPIVADFREVVAKHVCKDSAGGCTTSTEDTTTYTPTVNSSMTSNQYLDVVDPFQNLTHHEFIYCGCALFFSPRELVKKAYQGSSNLLRTIQTDYNTGTQPSNEALPIRVTTTLSDVTPNLVTKKEWDYDTYTLYYPGGSSAHPIDNSTAEREYDYGSGAPGSLLRQTLRTWLHTNPVNGLDYTGLSVYILNRKLTEKIEDSGNNIFAQTQLEYDNYGSISASGAVQHDSAFGTGYTTRGNVTKSQAWRNSDGVWLATTKTYDDAGNILSITAPSNAPYDTYTRTTTLSYADAWANGACTPSGGSGAAYVTAVTNAITQTSHYTYNSCTGTMASTTDPNSQPASFSYDLAARLSQTTFPDTGSSSYCFSDLSAGSCYSAGQLYMTRTDAIAPGSSKIGKAYVDGIGNVVQSQLASDPEGVDYTDITYDALSRKSSVSNPHRSTTASTDGTAQSTYDPLSRVIVLTQPDGSTVNTSYLGNQTTVTDEAGKKRMSQSDGLGRLTSVWEDPATLNYETDYTYDVLNNLLTVTQKGGTTDSTKWRPRTFSYNSLSQLTSATNPESGNILYAYDNVGNVVSKTSPAPNQTNPSVHQVIAFCYDAVNRMTSKWYATPPTNCPQTSTVANYFYDQTSYNGLAIANGVGRRTGMNDGSGATAWSYDSMGRVVAERLKINGVSKTIATTYNLDGSTNTITYPSGSGSVVAYTYNAAGHVTQVKDTVHNVTYLQSTSYAPPGELALGTYGGVTQTSIFNNRLQPCWYYATTGTALATSTVCTGTATAANILDLKYNFAWGTNDNGTLQSVTNDKDSNRSVSYTYDSLNRIASATTPNTDCTVLSSGITKNWGETFTIDAWGNLTNRTTTKCSAEGLSVVVLSNNQLSGFGYDVAGNMTANGSATYIYDAENRLQTAASVTYTYDGDGKRVIKSSGTEYWGAGPLLESDGNGNLVREFVFLAGRRIARRDIGTGNASYFFSDDLGSTDKLTNAAGTIQNDSEYYPYGGERIYGQGAVNQNYRFTGKEHDTESGLDNFGARYDASSLGRFMTPDPVFFQAEMPIDPQRFNQYAYVRNNPLRLIDPKGESIKLTGDAAHRQAEMDAICAAVGVVACSYLKQNAVTTTDANGNSTTDYYVGIYTNGPTGSGPAFENLNSVAGEFSAIINDRQVAEFQTVQAGTVIQGYQIGPAKDGATTTPGLTYKGMDGKVHVFILDPSTNAGSLPPRMMKHWDWGVIDAGILTGHEFGHGRALMTGGNDFDRGESALRLENKVRTLRDPNANTRIEEHDPLDSPF